jgi:hypothetical protein
LFILELSLLLQIQSSIRARPRKAQPVARMPFFLLEFAKPAVAPTDATSHGYV